MLLGKMDGFGGPFLMCDSVNANLVVNDEGFWLMDCIHNSSSKAHAKLELTCKVDLSNSFKTQHFHTHSHQNGRN
jgi:hypothetical protein